MGANIRAIGSATHRLDITETLAGKEVLVTGVTGFLGKVWLSELLHRTPQIGRVHLLIRPSSSLSALERFEAIAERSPALRPLREAHGADYEAFLRERIAIVPGDITQPMCGLDNATVRRLARGVDAVVHFAGLTDFDPDPRLAMDINVLGADNLADLTDGLGAKLLHCSTTFVAGNVNGNVPESFEVGLSPAGVRFDPAEEIRAANDAMDAVDESVSDPKSRDARKARTAAINERAHALGWPNIYTYTKGLSEHRLGGRKTSTTIVRPAVVECARTYPFEGWNEGINTSGPLIWFISSFFGHLPCRADLHFDVVPVDTVSRATTTVLAALLRGEAEAVYHLGSSSTNPFTTGRALELTNLGSRKYRLTADTKPLERYLLRFMDCVPQEWDETPIRSVPGLKRMSTGVQSVLSKLDFAGIAPPPLRGLAQTLNGQRDWAMWSLNKADKQLDRMQWMLDAYRPFIHDNDCIFLADNIRALSSRLEGDDIDTYGWDIDTLEWRTYWIDTVYPGISKWTLPELHGTAAPQDPPMARPITLSPQPVVQVAKAVS